MGTDADKVEIYISLDRHVHNMYSHQKLPKDATIEDLKEALEKQFIYGPPFWHLTKSRKEDFMLAPEDEFRPGKTPPLSNSTPLRNVPSNLVIVLPSEIGTELVELSEVVEYRVLQRNLIKKPSTDPSAQNVVRITRKVGSTVFTTGRTWTGPQGGEWVELDSVVERIGWVLIQGPGFGVPGPILQKNLPGEIPPMVLYIEKPGDDHGVDIHMFVLNLHSKVREAKEWIALICGLEPFLIIIGPKDSDLEPTSGHHDSKLLTDEDSMSEAGYTDGDKVRYCYIGDLKKGYEGKEPTWKGKLGVAERAKHQSSQGQKTQKEEQSKLRNQSAHLKKYFQALDLPETTPPDEIKRHYRRLALACHPDKHPDDRETATTKFQEMKAAYESIRDALDF